MIAVGRWFERKFRFDFPIQLYPNVVERLRGTPVRLEEKAASLSPTLLTRRDGSSWSIQENIGHLLDLEALHAIRLQEFLKGAQALTAADLKNQKTHATNHNAGNIKAILKGFRTERSRLVSFLEDLDETVVSHTALHPAFSSRLIFSTCVSSSLNTMTNIWLESANLFVFSAVPNDC